MIKNLSDCQEHHLTLSDSRRIPLYRDRHRGANESDLFFLVGEFCGNGLTWWCADSIAMSEFLESPELLSRYERGAYVSIGYRCFEVAIRKLGRNAFTAVVLT